MNPSELGIRPVWAEIDLDNLAHNIREVKRIVSSDTLIMAAVKADAYGHGALWCARTFLENGSDRLATATLGEALELRRNGVTARILCLGYIPSYLFTKALENDIGITIYRWDKALELSKTAVKEGKEAIIHIKVDTGMGRLGLQVSESTHEEIIKICNLPGIFVEGIFTHFAVADEPNQNYTRQQYSLFNNLIKKLEIEQMEIPIKHVSNSAAIIDYPEYNLDLVRPGIMLYGFYPSRYVNHSIVDLRPAMKLKAKISHIKKVPKETRLSYGLTFKTARKSKIATVPAGYADGYRRDLSNRGEVFVKGKRAPIVGRICMDQFMIDVTEISGIEMGDTITLLGDGSNEAPSIEEAAHTLETITHEITCSISRRVPRVYIKDNNVVGATDFFKP